ncbi:hypothetical protein GEMRC1_009026 [Eukaryota sp. GEM-RC1]
MFIKQIIIQGFKSFKEQTIVDPFSPNHNIIVGANGSGKSNFFFAIRFVLSDHFSNLSIEERQRLLHEGAGTVLSAYVEIIFDNTDGRIPVDSDEVIIRRTIGAKKDEWSLSRKTSTRNEVFSLLEAAGFSRSHPYYIVQQGKVEALATMSDSGRLQVLFEVAGTSTYDSRREESLKIMESTKISRHRIDDSLSRVEERLQELDTEKEELQEFQVLDKQRKSLEFAVISKNLEISREQLETNESKRKQEVSKASEAHHAALKAAEDIRLAEQELSLIVNRLEITSSLINDLEEEKTDLVRKRTQLQLDVSQSSELSRSREDEKKTLEVELAALKSRVATKQQEIESNVMPSLLKAEERVKNLLMEKESNQAIIEDLIGRSGRSKQFNSIEERDAWLKNQLSQAQSELSFLMSKKDNLSREIEVDSRSVQDQISNIQQKSNFIAEESSNISSRSAEYTQLKTEKSTILGQIKDLHRDEAAAYATMENFESIRSQEKSNLSSIMPKGLSAALDYLREKVEEQQVSGVYGPVIELFSTDPAFFPAVESVAKNQLFHVVVENEDVAATCIQLLQRAKKGRVTFIPLSALSPRPPITMTSEDYFPLCHDFITMVKLAASLAPAEKVNCVTVEGDLVERKGLMTGGFHQSRNSRLSVNQRLTNTLKEERDARSRAREIESNRRQLETRLDSLSSKLYSIEHSRSQGKLSLEQGSSEVEALKRK